MWLIMNNVLGICVVLNYLEEVGYDRCMYLIEFFYYVFWY